MKIATSVLAAALLSARAAWAGDPGVSDTEIKIGDVNIMTGPAAFIAVACRSARKSPPARSTPRAGSTAAR
jgi:branched-chain amino acid transport system substrate-binding protein